MTLRKYTRQLMLIFLVIGMASAAFDINGDGGAVDYSKMALSARYLAMGKSGVAFADDSGGVMLNPASYGFMRSLEVSAMNTKLLGEFNYSFISGVWPLQNETLGFSFLREDPIGTIWESNDVNQYGQPIQGEKLEAYSQMIGVGYGRKAFLDNLYLGGLMKFSKKKLAYVEASAVAFDFGALYRYDQDLAFGINAKNLIQNAYAYSNSGYKESVSPELVAGLAWTFFNKSFILAVDRHITTGFGKTNLGLEYWLGDMIAFRSGLAEKDLTLGLGFRWDLFKIDYAMRFQDAPLENEAYISISYGNASSFLLAKPEIEIVDDGGSAKANAPVRASSKKQSDAQASDGIQVIE